MRPALLRYTEEKYQILTIGFGGAGSILSYQDKSLLSLISGCATFALTKRTAATPHN